MKIFFDFNVFDISSNSRIIKNNFIFGALQGKENNGENYIDDLVKYNKIVALISKKKQKKLP